MGLNAGFYNNHDIALEPWYIEKTPGNTEQIGWTAKPIKENKFGTLLMALLAIATLLKKVSSFA